MSEVDTTNKFLVSLAAGNNIIFLKPLPQKMSYNDALLLSAYIVSIVADDEKWEEILTAVQGG